MKKCYYLLCSHKSLYPQIFVRLSCWKWISIQMQDILKSFFLKLSIELHKISFLRPSFSKCFCKKCVVVRHAKESVTQLRNQTHFEEVKIWHLNFWLVCVSLLLLAWCQNLWNFDDMKTTSRKSEWCEFSTFLLKAIGKSDKTQTVIISI